MEWHGFGWFFSASNRRSWKFMLMLCDTDLCIISATYCDFFPPAPSSFSFLPVAWVFMQKRWDGESGVRQMCCKRRGEAVRGEAVVSQSEKQNEKRGISRFQGREVLSLALFLLASHSSSFSPLCLFYSTVTAMSHAVTL